MNTDKLLIKISVVERSLNDLCDYCEHNNIKPRFVGVPLIRRELKALKKEYKMKTHRIMI